jgi:hypothetical protein
VDAHRFDDVLRSLVSSAPRRRVLGGLTGALLGGLALTRAAEDAAARKRRKKKKRRCKPDCRGTNACGGDGCGGSCGTCLGGTCRGGNCDCPGAQEVCRGRCVASCAGGTVRHALTCDCCLTARTTCDPNDPGACCTGDCFEPPNGDPICTGRDTGQPCSFGGQCFFGSCRGGICN